MSKHITLTYGIEEKTVVLKEDSYRYRTIMGENSITLLFSLDEYVDFPIGTNCTFNNSELYTLERPATFVKINSVQYDYTLVLLSEASKLSKYKLKNIVDNRLKFSYTAKPHEFLELIVSNLNLRDSGWSVGSYIEATEKVLSFNHQFVSEALQMVADEFETEWQINNKVISLGKVEHNKENPLELSYGKGNGFKSGIIRTNFDNSKAIEVLYVQGGDRNMETWSVQEKTLKLPPNIPYKYDGKFFENEVGFDHLKQRTYIADNTGTSIQRYPTQLVTKNEDSIDLSNIYPKRVGVVSSVVVVDVIERIYKFIDTSIGDFNYSNYILAGETMTVIFQSGMLSGKEFEVIYDHNTRAFEIIRADIDGQPMPNWSFKPVVGDKYIIYGIGMPYNYIKNDFYKSGASWDMYREAIRYLYDNEMSKFSFTGELDGIWSRLNWGEIGGKIKLGGYVLFSDNQFLTEGELIRIVGIKEYISRPYSPEIELSNVTVKSNIVSELKKIEATEVVVSDSLKESMLFTKRRFNDAKETSAMLEKSLLHFGNSVNPITVNTMQALIGDKSLQFRFVNEKINPVQISYSLSYNNETKILSGAVTILQHMTFGIDSISSDHDISEYRFWDVAAYESAVISEKDKPYYIYVRCNKNSESANFMILEEAMPIETEYFYFFLYGVLNSEDSDGVRSLAPMYGYTEILPGQIRTDKIISSDGQSFMDFISNSFQLQKVGVGSSLRFNVNGDGQLVISGILIQNTTGSLDLGSYNSSTVYSLGDKCSYFNSATNTVDTYSYQYATPSSGKLPTNKTYWRKVDTSLQIYIWKGTYDNTAVYKGNTMEINVVYSNGIYYHSKVDAPNGTTGFSGKIPNTTTGWEDYWKPFESQFSNIATKQIIAEQADFGDWEISGEYIKSKNEYFHGAPFCKISSESENGIDFIGDNEELEYLKTNLSKYGLTLITDSSGQNKVTKIQSGGIELLYGNRFISPEDGSTNLGYNNGIYSAIKILSRSFTTESTSSGNAVAGLVIKKASHASYVGAKAEEYGLIAESVKLHDLTLGYLMITDTSNLVINENAVYVSVNCTIGITVLLNPYPKKGKTLIIRRSNSKSVQIDGNGYIIWYDWQTFDTVINITTGGTAILLVFNGVTWEATKLINP